MLEICQDPVKKDAGTASNSCYLGSELEQFECTRFSAPQDGRMGNIKHPLGVYSGCLAIWLRGQGKMAMRALIHMGGSSPHFFVSWWKCFKE